MLTALDRGFGNPLAPDFRAKNIVKVKAGGVAPNVHIDTEHIWWVFLTKLEAIHGGGFLAKGADDWGWIVRAVRGYEERFKTAERAYRAAKTAAERARHFAEMIALLSNHSWGTAVDLNSATNPMGPKRTTFKVAETRALCAELGVSWGYDYTGARKDAMHFEILTSAAEARARNAAIKKYFDSLAKAA